MTAYKNIRERLGPCGLSCEKCFAYSQGSIKHHSKALQTHLGNFDVFAQRFATLLDNPVFKKYPDFKEFLSHLSRASCAGCRKDNCQLFKTCQVKNCSRSKQVDFCFQCDEFPCGHTGFDEHLQKRWLTIQSRMKETGVVHYYEETKDIPRY